MSRYLVPVFLALILLAGCTTLRETQPTQTARHQLLLSTAADHASAKIKPNLPSGNRIFVDASNFGSGPEYQDKYAINAIKTALLRQGYGLAPSAAAADTVAEVSSGALSIDRRERLFGIPSAEIPIPLTGALNTPELALWKSKERTGIAKFLITFYDAKSGTLQYASGPLYGYSFYDQSSILFFGRTKTNILPDNSRGKDDGGVLVPVQASTAP